MQGLPSRILLDDMAAAKDVDTALTAALKVPPTLTPTRTLTPTLSSTLSPTLFPTLTPTIAPTLSPTLNLILACCHAEFAALHQWYHCLRASATISNSTTSCLQHEKSRYTIDGFEHVLCNLRAVMASTSCVDKQTLWVGVHVAGR